MLIAYIIVIFLALVGVVLTLGMMEGGFKRNIAIVFSGLALCMMPFVGSKVENIATVDNVMEVLEAYKGLDKSLVWGVEEMLKNALSDQVLTEQEVLELAREIRSRNFSKMVVDNKVVTNSISEKSKAIGTLALEICARNPEHVGC